MADLITDAFLGQVEFGAIPQVGVLVQLLHFCSDTAGHVVRALAVEGVQDFY